MLHFRHFSYHTGKKMVIMHFNRAKKFIKKSLKAHVSRIHSRGGKLIQTLWRITKTSLFIITIRPETFIKQINLVSFDFLLTLKVSFICIKCTHPQLIQDEFVSSSEQIWRNVALHHLLSMDLCSEWVPSDRESEQLKKHHNNPHHSSPSVNTL